MFCYLRASGSIKVQFVALSLRFALVARQASLTTRWLKFFVYICVIHFRYREMYSAHMESESLTAIQYYGLTEWYLLNVHTYCV